MAKKATNETPEAPKLNVRDADDLQRIVASCRAAECYCLDGGTDVNNVFPITYRELGAVAQRLLDLFAERGHTGVKP